ncbi:Alpha/Beta hydrolase protein [Blastocladiella britannica]|nr:Alpha/Beta hydrolase protein [Blastocladiella britannica]
MTASSNFATPPASPPPVTKKEAIKANPFLELVSGQSIQTLPAYTLECGVTLPLVDVAYKTWGNLNATGDNVLVVCHALSGSADAADWWAPLLGPGRAFDTRRFYIVCLNVLGSPYGSTSPLSVDPATGDRYGAHFPVVSVRDDIRLHRQVLDRLGVKRVQFVVGGSMGGMQVLEWGAVCGPEYIRALVPMATSSRHSAWCISWGEAQRQAIFADPNYADGHYSLDRPPVAGLASARMQAMLTYRSRNSFESRFGRKVMTRSPPPPTTPSVAAASSTTPTTTSATAEAPVRAVAGPSIANAPLQLAHNDGLDHYHPDSASSRAASRAPSPTPPSSNAAAPTATASAAAPAPAHAKLTPGVFSAQSYMRYQGDKFVARFDANCYVALTRKLDTHDVSRGRTLPPPWLKVSNTEVIDGEEEDDEEEWHWRTVRAYLPHPTLVLGVESDGLFTLPEQQALASRLANARLQVIASPDGHDGFLLEFEQVGRHVAQFMREIAPELFSEDVTAADGTELGDTAFSSRFGEADLVAW